MNPALEETTMDPKARPLIKVTLPAAYEDRQPVKDLVEQLMGKDPAKRFDFIQARASAVEDDAIDA
jgi:topoisomerase-4 subunit B